VYFCIDDFEIMMSDKSICADRLKQLVVLLEAPPTYRAAVLLLCVTAGCVGVDTHTSVTHEAVTITTIPVTGAVVSDPENDPQFGPMVAVADFNSDGNPDMAASDNHDAVSVRLGDGAGGFGAESLFNLNLLTGRPNAVMAKDLNADGKIDLVMGNDPSVSVLLGNGDGTFGAATTYALLPTLLGGFSSVTAGDFNRDGKLDLAAGEDGGVGVLPGNGDGTFGARSDFICDQSTHHNSVIAGDFNLDGKIDLVSAGSKSSSVYFFPGNGDGTFAACTATTVGTTFVPVAGEATHPVSMTTGDFNRDGKPDLATANNFGISVTVLLNQGNGTFVTQDYPFFGHEFDMLFVGATKLDSDDSLDLFVAHQFSVFFMSGSTSGTFTKTSSFSLPSQPRFVVAGHFDHDPTPRNDFLLSTEDGNVRLLRGDPESAPCTSGCTPFVVGSEGASSTSAAPGPTNGLKMSIPSGFRNGDVLYAFLTKNGATGQIVTPAGWTQLDQFITTDGDFFTTGLWRRVVTDASLEPLSVRFTHTDTKAKAMTAYIVAVRGANPVTPEDAPVAHLSGLDTLSPTNPSVTTVSPSALVLWHEGLTGRAVSSLTGPFGATLLQATKATDSNSGVAVLLQTTPGATLPGQWRNSDGSTSADFHTLTVAVRPL
jgi:hypothetical protein